GEPESKKRTAATASASRCNASISNFFASAWLCPWLGGGGRRYDARLEIAHVCQVPAVGSTPWDCALSATERRIAAEINKCIRMVDPPFVIFCFRRSDNRTERFIPGCEAGNKITVHGVIIDGGPRRMRFLRCPQARPTCKTGWVFPALRSPGAIIARQDKIL